MHNLDVECGISSVRIPELVKWDIAS